MRLRSLSRRPSVVVVCLVVLMASFVVGRPARGSANFSRTVSAEVLSVSDAGTDQVNLRARLLDGTELHAAGDTVSVVAACSRALAERLRSGDTISLGWRYTSGMVRDPDGGGGRGVESESWYVAGLAPPESARRRSSPSLELSIPPSPRVTAPARPARPSAAVRSRVFGLIDEACAPRVTPERLQQLREALSSEGRDGERLLRADLVKTEASLASADQWEKDGAEWWDQSRADKVAALRSMGQRRRVVLLDLIAACVAASAKGAE